MITYSFRSLCRFKKFTTRVGKATSPVQPQSLPPTSNSASYHSLHVYLTVQSWRDAETVLSPLEWGWMEQGNAIIPIMSTAPPAPDKLLKVVRCNCLHDCNTKNCTCRKHNLKCSGACGHCRGCGYSNAKQILEDDDLDLQAP